MTFNDVEIETWYYEKIPTTYKLERYLYKTNIIVDDNNLFLEILCFDFSFMG